MGLPVNYGDVLYELQMEQDEVDFMVKTIEEMTKDGLMVEWGCGGSTCKWIETLKPTQKLITIEHTEMWYNRVARAVRNEFEPLDDQFTFIHVGLPYEEAFEHVYSELSEEHPFGCDMYINPPEKFNIWNADIFFIDGIARAACAMAILAKHKKKSPKIFLHDYKDREPWYGWALQFFDVEIVAGSLAQLTFKKK